MIIILLNHHFSRHITDLLARKFSLFEGKIYFLEKYFSTIGHSCVSPNCVISIGNVIKGESVCVDSRQPMQICLRDLESDLRTQKKPGGTGQDVVDSLTSVSVCFSA